MSAVATHSRPVESLSQSEIKSELANLYGVTDISDCLELSDLKNKLSTVRDTQPITWGLRYGKLLEVGNRKSFTGLVTLSHGLGDSCHGWEDVAHELAKRFRHLLFLLPTAPQRPVSINGGYEMPAWYDIREMISSSLKSGQQDATGVFQSADYISSLALTTARRLNVSPNRLLFAGFSQGAAVSLAAGLLSTAARPAGVALMSGYLPAAVDVLAKHKALLAEDKSFAERFSSPEKATAFAMFHGQQDPVVPFAAAKETKQLLEKEVLHKLSGDAATVAFFGYNMQHSAIPSEIDELARFIARVLPE